MCPDLLGMGEEARGALRDVWRGHHPRSSQWGEKQAIIFAPYLVPLKPLRRLLLKAQHLREEKEKEKEKRLEEIMTSEEEWDEKERLFLYGV